MKLTKLYELATNGAPLLEDKEEKVEIHISPKGPGVLGHVITMDAGDSASYIAEILGVPDGWTRTKVGKGYAAYNAGDRLTFFSNPNDFQEDEDEGADIDDMIDDDHPEAKAIKDKLEARRKK